jgi:hypothetical protein
MKTRGLGVFAKYFAVLMFVWSQTNNFALSQELWTGCPSAVSGLDFFTKALLPNGFCDRIQFISIWPGKITALEKQSQPVTTNGSNLLTFVDLKSAIPSLHTVIWYGHTNLIDSSFVEQLRPPGVIRMEANTPADTVHFEVLLDGKMIRAADGVPSADWAGSSWENLVAGAQVVPFLTFGMGLISVLLTEEGRRHVISVLESESGWHALLGWPIVHTFSSQLKSGSFSSSGGFSCLQKDGRVFDASNFRNRHPIMHFLPIDLSNLEQLKICD